ncbi:MAG: glycosyltransferase family 39 protein [Bryobacteraceae bacterium]|jgi:4-amino-4-deoxy-L-arabinose transferase-like glycosyltransferase
MPRRIPRLLWLVIPLAYILYFHGLGAFGLLGPDEPRYASIGREMARSGDWVTPRLWGQPWFEKPALLYWMTGAAFRLGLGTSLAPRLPVAMMAVAFLGFYWWIVRREFGSYVAWLATLILGTSGMWLGFSQVGVTDLPLAATFSAAMLLALPWAARRDARFLPAAGAMLGLAVLAKGLTPLVLAAPVLPVAWFARRSTKSLTAEAPGRGEERRLAWLLGVGALAMRVIAPFLAVALPWYLLCSMRNGSAFLTDFFWRQHFLRFTSGALMHGQPWWYYLPVFAAAFLPWTPLLVLSVRGAPRWDVRRLLLLAWVAFGLIFFSLSVNKLAGYILPLLPAAALLAALALAEAAGAGMWLAACALLLAALPMAGAVLPAALVSGLSQAPWPVFQWVWLAPAAMAAAAWALEKRGRRLAAVAAIAAGAGASMLYVKQTALPEVDRAASARGLWLQVAPHAGETCVDTLQRDWRYGLNYYSVTPLPDCAAQPRPLRVRQLPGRPPFPTAASPPAMVDPLTPGVVISRSEPMP